MKNILVIGGSGFIGSALIPKLLETGHRVTVLNRGRKTLDGVIQLKADRNSKASLAAALQRLPENSVFDAVIDTSAYTLAQTQHVFELLSPTAKHWVHLSSAAVYKASEGFPQEDAPMGGAEVWGDYGVEKSAIDRFLLQEQHEVPVTVLRPPYVYGPENNNLRERFVWGRAFHHEPIFVPGDGKTPMQFLHVEDLAEVLVLCALQPPRGRVAYNVAADEKIGLKDWVTTVLAAGNMTTEVVTVGAVAAVTARQYFPFRDYPCCVATDLLRQEMGWRPKYDALLTGLRQTFASYSLEVISEQIPVSEAEVLLLSYRLRGVF